MFSYQRLPKNKIDIQTQQYQSVNFSVVNLAHIAKGHSQKKDVSPIVVNCYHEREEKYVKDISCVDQLSFVKPVTNIPTVDFVVLENLGNSGCRSESNKNPQTKLYPLLSDLAELDKVIDHHKVLCQSSQEPQKSLGVFNQLFLVSLL